MKTDEDDEFDRIERENKIKGQPYHFALQRTWIGLTDEEIDKAWRSVNHTIPYAQFRVDVARAIETKLKEKNS